MFILSRIKQWIESKFAIPLDSKLVFSRKDFITTDFTLGIEFLNDDKTSMEFVIEVFMKYFDLTKDDATVAMLICHEFGSVVIPVDSADRGDQLVQAVIDEARHNSYPFECKVISNDVLGSE